MRGNFTNCTDTKHQHSNDMNLHISLTSPRICLGLQEART